MLVDDNKHDNFYHERIIKKSLEDVTIVVKTDGLKAIQYLLERKNSGDPKPNLILLDINMPVMNGWEFLDEYNKLDPSLQSDALVIMLTTSANPSDIQKTNENQVATDYKTKP